MVKKNYILAPGIPENFYRKELKIFKFFTYVVKKNKKTADIGPGARLPGAADKLGHPGWLSEKFTI